MPTEGYTFARAASRSAKSLSYNGSFNFTFPDQWALTVSPQMSYSQNSRNTRYQTSILPSAISNDADEKTYNAFASFMLRTICSDVHYLFLRGFGGFDHYKVWYSGSTRSIDRIIERYIGVTAQYGYYTDKVSADLMVGVRGEHNNTNAVRVKEFYPFVNANFSWSPNSDNSLNCYLSYAREPMSANLKSPNIIQEDELMFYTGNPVLRMPPTLWQT